MCHAVYGQRLKHFGDIRSVYDFDTFVSGYRPGSADKKLKKQFRLELQVRAGKVFVRTKRAISARVQWNEYQQMYPSLFDLRDHTPHAADVAPATVDNKPWDDLELKVSPTLKK